MNVASRRQQKNLMNNNLMSPKEKNNSLSANLLQFSFHFHLFFLPFIFNLHICEHTHILFMKNKKQKERRNEWVFMKIWLRHEMSFEDQSYCRQIYSTSVRSRWLFFLNIFDFILVTYFHFHSENKVCWRWSSSTSSLRHENTCTRLNIL